MTVDLRKRASTDVDGHRRDYADMEYMLKGLRVNTKRVYVRGQA